jgi:hypothetical protein
MEKILKVTPLENFRLEILTDTNLVGIFDMKPYLTGSAFKPLLNIVFFNTVSTARYGITWEGELDISSDTIVFDMKNGFSESCLLTI